LGQQTISLGVLALTGLAVSGNLTVCGINDLVVLQFIYTLDATPSGSFVITAAPITGFTTLSGVSGTGMALDLSADNVHAICPRTRDSGANIDFTTNAESDFATMTSTKPFTFASGDSIRTVMVYRAA
jgi:hypothetical protein